MPLFPVDEERVLLPEFMAQDEVLEDMDSVHHSLIFNEDLQLTGDNASIRFSSFCLLKLGRAGSQGGP